MIVNGVNFNEEFAKSKTEAEFVKAFEKTSWFEAKGGDKFVRDVHKKIAAKAKEEADVAKAAAEAVKQPAK